MQQKQHRTIRVILNRLGSNIKTLTALRSRMLLPPESDAMQWLHDNLYLIVGQAGMARSDLAAIGRREHLPNIDRLSAGFTAGFTEATDITPAFIESLIERVCSDIELTYAEFCLLPALLRTTLVDICRRSAEGEMDGALVGRAVLGLIALGSVDMEAAEERLSAVHKRLTEDPAGVYPGTAIQSRQYLRRLCYRISRATGLAETEVAKSAVSAARADTDPRRPGVAAYLMQHPAITAPARRTGRLTIGLPIAIGVALSALIGLAGRSLLLCAFSILPLTEVARLILSPIMTRFTVPGHLLQMEEPAPESQALVAVANLVPAPEKAADAARHLRRLYYKNRGENAQFLLLCDFPESDSPTTPSDKVRASALIREVEKLNEKHGPHFALVIRRRSLNPREESFAGRGRKMGAIQDLFAFAAGEEADFYAFVGDISRLRRSTHCLVLDADTEPALGSIREMMATAAHPFNRPIDKAGKGRITDGYGILVPRIAADLGSAKATLFAKVIEGSGGVTAYDTAIADPYQDTFGEAVFAGKGLIDMAAYRAVTADQLPGDRMLSHDLIEGEYLRCGLLSQVEFTDATPPTAHGYLKRLSRWVRGDWQNAVFLFRRFRWGGVVYHNRIGFLGKYKIADNLRRHLTPIFTLLCALMAAVLRHPSARIYALVFWTAVLAPFVRELVTTYLKDGYFALSRRYFSGALTLFADMLGRLLFSLCLLPAQALIILDSTVRAIYRSAFSGKRMLQWQTAAQVEASGTPLSATMRIGGPCFIAGIGFCLLGGCGVPIGIAFCFGLPFAVVSGRKPPDHKVSLGDAVKEQYASWAAAIWQFFEDYTTADNHFLPPDNVQFFPVCRQARRTSPTNIGFYLLSALTAADLGLIDPKGLYQRIERTIATVERLEKHAGNLYNWYDTATLQLLNLPFVSSVDSGNFLCCLLALREGLADYAAAHSGMPALIERVDVLIKETDLSIFFDKNRRLFVIGLDENGEKTPSCYDFFMSESRLTSYWAVASGMADKKHWGRLSRAMSRSGPHAGPLSWTGTLFEYFMPALLLPGFEGSLTDEALHFCLYCQMKRGREMKAPWGISESGFYAFDGALNYQYKAHGVQKNGVKQGLDKDKVVAPYATFLAAPFAPNAAYRNLHRLKKDGVYGQYGFYEAADYRDPERPDVVRSYMSHHMGMSLAAVGNLLCDGILQRRFVRNPVAEAGLELLQEKVSKKAVMIDQMNMETPERKGRTPEENGEIAAPSPFAATGHLLSNGMMAEVVSDSGAGYLWAGGVELTRRSDDPVRPQGIFTVASYEGSVLSPTLAPLYDRSRRGRCVMEPDSVTFAAQTTGVDIEQTDSLHPKFAGLVRRIILHNTSDKAVSLDLLCYFEPVLTDYRTYSAHPAFAKMGLAARVDSKGNMALFSRRQSGGSMALAAGFADDNAPVDYLLDRQALLPSPGGIGGLENFADVVFDGRVSHDCCFAARRRVALKPGERRVLFLLVAQGTTEEEAAGTLVNMRFAAASLGRMRTAARFAPQSAEGRIAAMLLGQMRFGRPAGSIQQKAAAENGLSQDFLWGLGISGDLPLVVVEAGQDDTQRAAVYLRIQKAFGPCGCGFDLVVLCPDESSRAAIERALALDFPEGTGEGLKLLNMQHVSGETLTLMRAAACHIATPDSVGGGRPTGEVPVKLLPVRPANLPGEGIRVEGGSLLDGVFRVERRSPLPYNHILTGPVFGTLLSDTALGFSFYQNARENKLTPWFNDPSSHNDGEQVALRMGSRVYDLVKGSRAEFHADYARYRGEADGLSTDVRVWVADKAACKRVELTLTNNSEREVELMCAYYTEPVLGVDRAFSRMLRPRWEEGEGLVADNPYSVGFRTGMHLWADGGGAFPITSRESYFTGRWEHSCRPDADPCAAVVVPMKLPPRRREKVSFVLSAADSAEAAKAVTRAALAAERREKAAKLRIKTPDALMDAFVNHFAPGQIIGGRLEGRTGFYQCGGAYGFRDQLQDTYGLLLTRPDLARKQILKAAAAQFEEGDVLHWWHQMPAKAGGKKGVRTRCSDDLLWLPFVTAAYVNTTGDEGLLSVPVRYLLAEPLRPGQQDSYIQPGRSDVRGSVYEHCLRAIDRACALGEHGLPLIGAGDWNDGFSAVGAEGRGESVWLALFAAMVMEDFIPLMRLRGDTEQADRYRERAAALREAVETHAWDGDHYLRAFFDDGSPMGGGGSRSCQIDLLPQSFAVIAGLGSAGRTERAMQSAYERLVDRENGIIRLFTPHFGRDSYPNPGYVSAYPEGIRENGGQYTHGALWFVLALLRQGRADEAAELLGWINPLSRSANPDYAPRYLTEPYYMAADIYASPNTPGRGGWTIYTGAASWYYRIVWGELLGIKREGERLTLTPRIPGAWPGFEAELEIEGALIRIEARRTGEAKLVVDGTERPFIPVDGRPHTALFTF